MIDLQEVKQFIRILNKLAIPFFVSGGVGIDGLRGHLSREHKDLDIYLMANDLDCLFLTLKKQGYRCFRKLNKYEVQAEGIKVDILPLKEEGNTYYLKGNAMDTRFPKEIFDKHLEGNIDDLFFPVIPGEIFALEMPYSKYFQDKQLAETIQYDKSLLARIENVQKEKPPEISLEEL